MTETILSPLTAPAPSRLPAEIVERKGLGHPDTICDALAEALSRALCRHYLDRFGLILHHNVDKVLLRGGSAEPRYGGGRILAPIEIYLAGRATCEFRGVAVPIEELVRESCLEWLDTHLHALDPARDVRLHCLIRPGSPDLVDLYLRQQETGAPLANDTSCGIGYAPLDELERLVLSLEQTLNDPAFKTLHPELGEDIKIMGVRRGEQIALTLAGAFVDRHVSDLEDYLARKHALSRLVLSRAGEVTDKPVSVALNEADDPNRDSVYITVTGTSAEAGDDGEVGRGNRANGLITPYRPMNMEAAAGKNPVSHVGKLYNIVAQRIAETAVARLPEISEAQCLLVSRIGHPVSEPQLVDVRLRMRDGTDPRPLKPQIGAIVMEQLASLERIREELLADKLQVY